MFSKKVRRSKIKKLMNRTGFQDFFRKMTSRRALSRSLGLERLEARELLAADLLYTLRARPGVPDDLFGTASDANDQFHVVGNPALPVYGEPLGSFLGEVQIHDAQTGVRLRTIANPEPSLGFSFGTSIAIDQNYVLVGASGVDPREEQEVLPFPDLSGRAYLFDANTGNLLHTFQDNFSTFRDQTQNLDGFGQSLDIEGNTIVIGAPGIEPAPQNDANSDDPGHAYVFNRTTGNLIRRIENVSSANGFGTTVSLSQGRVVINGGMLLPSPDFVTGLAYVFDVVAGGPPLQTIAPPPNGNFGAVLSLDGDVLVADNSHFVNSVFVPSTRIYDADDGSFSRQIPVQSVASDGSKLATVRDTAYLTRLYDVTTGNLNNEVGIPASMNPSFVFDPPFHFSVKFVTMHDDRVLIPVAADGPNDESGVYVFSLNGPVNQPPTDIALSNNTIPENSANTTDVGTLSATDPTPGETLTFSLLNTAGGRFSLSGTQLRVANGSLLDFDTQSSHSIGVRVTDSAGNTYDEVFQILLTNVNEPPTDITLSPSSVAENAPNNTLIGNLTSNDPDSPDVQSFVLLNNAGGRFTLVGSSIRVLNESLLDYEASTSHTILVQVTDSLGLTFTETLTIQVNNVSDTAPTDLALRNSKVVENSPNGTLIAALDNPIRATLFGQEIAAAGTGSNAFLAIGSDGFDSLSGRVQIVRPKTGELLLTIPNPTPSINDRFGSTIVATDERVIVAATGDDTAATNSGAVYVFNRTTGLLERTITQPNPAAGNGFGTTMSVNGNALVIGNASGSSDVYVFNIATGQLLQTIAIPGAAAPASSVLIDSQRIYIGDSRFNQFSGRVHVFNRSTGNLIQTILNPDATSTASDFFGIRMAVTANSLVVSAAGEDVGGQATGKVYVFNAITGNLLQTLTQTTPDEFSSMGLGLVADGNRVLALASQADSSGDFAGRAYLFDINSGALIRVIDESPSQDFSRFGSSAAYLDDEFFIGSIASIGVSENGQYNAYLAVNGLLVDGFITIDPEPNETHTYQLLNDAGGRFALVGNNLVVANSSLLNFEAATSHDVVVRVTDSQGLSLDKMLTIQVLDVIETAPTDLSLLDSSIQEGAVYGTQVALVTSPVPRTLSHFGSSIDTDGSRTIIGSTNFQGSTATNGRIFVRNDLTGEILHTFNIPSNDTFLSSAAIDGNLAVVGASRDDTLGQDKGRAFVFDVTTGALLHTFSPPSQLPNLRFGISVDIRNQTVVVGTLHGQHAYVFNAVSGSQIFDLTQPGGEFGASVAISDNGRIVVADPAVASSEGRVYVYSENTGALLATINNPNPNIGDSFGHSIAVDEQSVLIGAPYDDEGATDTGRAYLYSLTSYALLETFNNPSPGAQELFGINGALSFSRVAIGNGNSTGSTEINLFDTFGGELELTIPSSSLPGLLGELEFGNFGLQACLFQPGGGGVIRIFNTSTGQPTSVFRVADDTPTPTYTYSLLDNAGGRFSIVGDQLVVANSSLINFNVAQSHTIVVQVTDGSGLSFSKALTVNVIDDPTVNQPPTNIALSTSTVPESTLRAFHNPANVPLDVFGASVAASSTRLVVSSTDSSNPKVNPGKVYSYDKVTGNLLATITSPGGVLDDGFGDQVAIAGNIMVVGAPRRDTSAVDSGQVYVYNATTGALKSTLRDPNPTPLNYFGRAVAISGDTFVVSSFGDDSDGQDFGVVHSFNLAIGSVVGTLSTADPNPNDAFTYTLSNSASGRFSVQGNQILVADARRLDFEAATTHNVTVQVTDSGGLTFSKIFPISLTNVNEPPRNINFVGSSVDENAANGTLVSTLNATDPDVGSTSTFSLLASAGGRFTISGNTIVVADGSMLDYESASSHMILVRVTDQLGLSTFESRLINLIDLGGASAQFVNGTPVDNSQIGSVESGISSSEGEAVDISLFQNTRNPADVNLDGIVSPLDILSIINQRNQKTRKADFDFSGTNDFIDVNGDHFLSPIDVLIAINSLNRQSRKVAIEGGEGDTSNASLHDQAFAVMSDLDFYATSKKRKR
ncbi:MAG: cadherin domain-containing protein [Pirellulaceae bacterium]|nr:cadherin domain-containing protein [Pirellulaceae bacterium]